MMKILMIDDDPNVAEIVSLGLQMRWPEAELVSTVLGKEGVRMVRNESPDIVILDLGLPDITGFQVLERVRQFSNVPVLILSVWGEEADIARGMELGATDYMVKPFSQVELQARIKALVSWIRDSALPVMEPT